MNPEVFRNSKIYAPTQERVKTNLHTLTISYFPNHPMHDQVKGSY